jgi:hypothetical protein
MLLMKHGILFISLTDSFWMDMLTRSISSPNNHYSQICNFSIIKITALLSSLSSRTGGFDVECSSRCNHHRACEKEVEDIEKIGK